MGAGWVVFLFFLLFFFLLLCSSPVASFGGLGGCHGILTSMVDDEAEFDFPSIPFLFLACLLAMGIFSLPFLGWPVYFARAITLSLFEQNGICMLWMSEVIPPRQPARAMCCIRYVCHV